MKTNRGSGVNNMAEIILNPDIEIVNEDDRKLYWLFRQAVDTQFLKSVKNHLEGGEHCYNICFNQYLDVRQLSLKQFVDQQSQQHHPKDIFEQLLDSIDNELTESLTNMIAVYREMERRGIKIK